MESKKVEEIVIGQEQSQDLDQVQELVQIGIGVCVVSLESMIILQGNVPVLSQMKIQIIATWIRWPYKCWHKTTL